MIFYELLIIKLLFLFPNLTFWIRMSSHTKHNAIRRSSPKSGKSPLSNKPNENSDTIYIVQNENDILKLKYFPI